MCGLEPAIDRIRKMEKRFDRLQEQWQADPDGFYRDDENVRQLQQVLEYYRSGRWQADYRLDEQGLLPPGLKRGVLSQDGLHNFLAQLRDRDRRAEQGRRLSEGGETAQSGEDSR